MRGAVKSFGARLPKCNAEGFHRKVHEHVLEALAPALEPLLDTIGSLTARIRGYDREPEAVSRELYPERRRIVIAVMRPGEPNAPSTDDPARMLLTLLTLPFVQHTCLRGLPARCARSEA